MGIKGIYKEIGPGERISLCKLGVDSLKNTGRPLRLAIDFSIWQFQVQAGRGGSNPAIRTLFYRLVRLLGLAIDPIFVFDGPNKPAFKRGKRSSRNGDTVATAMGKRLIRYFGFAAHDAPGEAEAECALLQQQGVVDAVLSEDVDTIMFGCGKTLRNWSAEGTKGSKTPTHVTVYDAAAVADGPTKLDREGMVLIALMSGGDYVPEGVPGCGIKVACEAAKAGFGLELCRLKKADSEGLAAWKTRLLHELRTNENHFFRTKHKSLEIPDNFPNMEILRYYTHPVVSNKTTVSKLKTQFPPKHAVDIAGLREFTRETFDWEFKGGAIKFVRVLAPSILVRRLLEGHSDDGSDGAPDEVPELMKITSQRTHFSTDATPELRISFTPNNVIGLDFGKEPEEEEAEAFGRSGIALNSDDEFEEEEAVGNEQPKTKPKKPFDPFQPDLAWVPTALVELSAPRVMNVWEEKQQAKERRAAEKSTKKPRTKKTDMPAGALDKYVKVTKRTEADAKATTTDTPLPTVTPLSSKGASQLNPPAPKGRGKQNKKSLAPNFERPPAGINPWTLASSQTTPQSAKRFLPTNSQVDSSSNLLQEPILLSSSPVMPTSPVTTRTYPEGDETTPTKLKRRSPSSEDMTSPPRRLRVSPTLTKRKLWVPPPNLTDDELPAQDDELPVQEDERAVQRGQSKGAKSKAGKTAEVTSSQTSIKSFGRTVKNVGLSRTQPKADHSTDTEPIEISSDEDDDDADFPPLVPGKPSASSISARKSNSPGPANEAGVLSDFDSPFNDRPSSKHKDTSSLLTTNVPQEKTKPVAVDKPEVGRTDFVLRTATTAEETTPSSPTPTPTTTTTTTATAAADPSTKPSGTTTIFIPRTTPGREGYFRTIEVDRDEASAVLAAHNSPEQQQRGAGRTGRRAWRQSDLTIYDLTGED
ncbi:uncharacterized protein C8A04DRAFT_29561 [Dichotomopilus funicola]|uniref:Uncharacterized protein n=1 Tax=Dichotomopilus funicola TaxID=1934379 RepID=A0AAN6ZM91_9PEZI|nr:hypothetical protein C8A04DRAFT_29561 [Dichotomopilus funicola]